MERYKLHEILFGEGMADDRFLALLGHASNTSLLVDCPLQQFDLPKKAVPRILLLSSKRLNHAAVDEVESTIR